VRAERAAEPIKDGNRTVPQPVYIGEVDIPTTPIIGQRSDIASANDGTNATPLPSSRAIRFDRFVLDFDSAELYTPDGRVVLQAQPFLILCALLERPGAVVERAALQRRLWTDGTFVDFDHSLNAAVRRLRRALDDDAARPRFIETVPRRGYRFLPRISHGPAPLGDRALAQSHQRRPRLAILPIAAGGGREAFAEGLTEELMVQVSRMNSDDVALIARSSAMAFKGARQQPSEIGQALAVDYLLEGNVRAVADRARVVASLVETSSDTHMWGDAMECSLTQPIAAQIEVATRLAESLGAALRSHRRPRSI
jgi:TolB-like protein